MFGLKKGQLMAIFIVVLMVGSILGFAFWSSEDSPREPTQPIDPQLPVNSIAFTAEGINAIVENTFNYLIIIGHSQEFEINKIDSELITINGIRQINNSRFAGDPKDSISSGLTYIAEITFDSNKKAEEIMQEIKEKTTLLEEIEGVLNAVVIIPEKITLINEDLNLTKEHKFQQVKTQAMVLPSTIAGDELLVSLEVNLNNNLVLHQMAFEEKNLTAEPVLVFIEKELELIELKPELELFASGNRSKFDSIEEINELIEEIQGINKAETNIINQENSINVYFNELTEIDVNSLTDFFEEKEIMISSDLNKKTISIQIDFEANYNEILSLTEEKMNELTGFDYLEEAEISIISEINFEGNEKQITEELINLFEGNEIELKQKALFFTETLINEENEVFEVQEPFEALITPGKTGNINLEIFFYGIRGKAEYIQAIEKE